MIMNFSSQVIKVYSKALGRGENCQPRTLYSVKMPFRNEDNKDILKGRKTKNSPAEQFLKKYWKGSVSGWREMILDGNLHRQNLDTCKAK